MRIRSPRQKATMGFREWEKPGYAKKRKKERNVVIRIPPSKPPIQITAEHVIVVLEKI